MGGIKVCVKSGPGDCIFKLMIIICVFITIYFLWPSLPRLALSTPGPGAKSAAFSAKQSTEKSAQRIPDALVVGAGKCGTDALITYLNISSEFVINSIQNGYKELNYFNKYFDRGPDWYVQQMPAVRPDQILIEKCAPYLWNPDVPKRVHDTRPNIKIIMVLCDPVKRMVSLYAHINSYIIDGKPNPLPPFTELIQLKDGQLVEQRHPYITQPLLDSGKYSLFVKQWLTYFPLDQMVFLSGEELVHNPISEISKLIKFLGKPDAITEENIYFDKEKGYFCFKNAVDYKWCLDRSKGRRHPSLSKELMQALHNHYMSYNEELKSLIHQDFGWPKYFGQE